MRILVRIILAAVAGILLSAGSGATDDDNCGAVYRYYDIESRVHDNTVKEKTRWKLDVLNRRGDRFSTIFLSATNFIELKKVSVKLYNAAGNRVEKYGRDDFIRLHGWDGISLYADAYTFVLEVDAPSYPYSIECEYETEATSLFFWNGAPLQQPVPVDSFRYALDIDTTIPFAWRHDGVELAHTEEIDGDRAKHVWSATDIEPFEPLQRQSDRLFPASLKFAAGRFQLGDYPFEGLSWDNVAAWYRSLAEDRYQPPTSSSTQVNSDAYDCDRLESIYYDVVSSVRYVAFSIGISGWQPAAAKDTRTCGYGDCKGMTTLLVANARAAGFEVYPALVLTRSTGRIFADFPEFGFNHVIAMAICDADTVWMDPTCDDCAYGDVPYSDEGTTALLVTDTSGHPIAIPLSAPSENRLRSHVSLELAPDGTVHLRSQYDATGNPGFQIRSIQQHADEDYNRQLARHLLGSEGWKVKSISYVDSACGPSKACLVIEGESRRPVRMLQNSYYVPLPVVPHETAARLTSMGMARSIDGLQAGMTIEESIELSIQPGMGEREIHFVRPPRTATDTTIVCDWTTTDSGSVLTRRVYPVKDRVRATDDGNSSLPQLDAYLVVE